MTGKPPFLPYGRQSIQQEDIRAVTKVLKKPIITRGETVVAFEKAVAEYCNVAYAVAFQSGSAALAGAMYAVDIGPYDEVVTTPNTFVSTVGTAIQRGATPLFVDIDRTTGTSNVEHVLSIVNQPLSRGKRLILPVHFAGIPVDVNAIEKAIHLPNTCIIEDAAHAFGSEYSSGDKVGSCRWSQCTIFSFHPVKNITTGEGGMVTTNDPALVHHLRLFRDNGIERDARYWEQEERLGYYEVVDLTNNFHLTDLQAALGLSQLGRVDAFVKRRRELVQKYRNLLGDIPHIRLFTDVYDLHTAFHLFVVQIDFAAYKTTREVCMQKLLKKGIGTQVHYIPLYRHPIFRKKYGNLTPYFPEMEAYYAEALTLPLFYDMQDSDVERVVTSLRECLD